mmetsp:Transcript_5847/g.6354  ORF Transcript_5847/g.6354 Transcript_5847/m.6354 type:complete len:516 (-) Transcript_5847:53-1600(-)
MQRLITQKLGSSLGQNDFFVGAIVLGLLSSGVALFYSICRYLWSEFQKAFIVSVEVKATDGAYTWMMMWLSERQSKATSRHLSAFARKPNHTQVVRHYGNSAVKKKTTDTKVYFLPAVGYHVTWVKGRMCWIYRGQNQKQQNAAVMGIPQANNEIIKISTYGRDIEFLKKIVYNARDLTAQLDSEKTIIYTAVVQGRAYWQRSAMKPKRPFKSVILDRQRGDELLNEIKTFKSLAKWYQDRGLNHRRGYLLYGPPGNGKTSFVQAIAGELNYNICMLSLSNPGLNDSNLMQLFQTMPEDCFLLLEDIDAAFGKKKEPVAAVPPTPDVQLSRRMGGRFSNDTGVTFSGLLNSLDGVQTQDGRILFMTTNHKEVLDPALIRPGRADRRLYFGNASREQSYNLFLHFYYSDINTKDAKARAYAKEFSEKLVDNLSMAHIQEYLLKHREEPLDAVQCASELTTEEEDEKEEREKEEVAKNGNPSTEVEEPIMKPSTTEKPNEPGAGSGLRKRIVRVDNE